MTAEERLIDKIGIPVALHDFAVDGVSVRCAVAGSGPVVVLLHGLNVGWGEWYGVLPALAANHTVVALDFPGAGGSAKIDFLTADIPSLYVAAVEAVLAKWAPQGAVIAGHSFGGWVGLTLASRHHPLVKGVIAVSPIGITSYLPWQYRPLAFRRISLFLSTKAAPPTPQKLAGVLSGVMAHPERLWSECSAYYAEHVMRPPVTHPFLFIHAQIRPFRIREELRFSDAQLAGIRCPVAFLHGRRDPLIPFARVWDRFTFVPRAVRVEAHDAGHVPPVEDAALVADTVRNLARSAFA